MEPKKNQYASFSIKWKDIMLLMVFYFFFALLYHLVLWYNRSGYEDNGLLGFFDIKDFWLTSGMAYFFYFITSILIWWFSLFLLKKWNFKVQAIFTFLAIPFVIYLVREIRYILIDYLEVGRLTGTGEIWDWYIPVLQLYFQFGVLFAYQYFIETQERLKAEAALTKLALQSELSAIKAQLNPHFLYNVFNTINASVPSDNEKTRNLIAQLSDLFRYQLRASKEDLVPLGDEIEFVKKYLDLEQERFGDRLKITYNISKSLYTEKIPPMLIQPLVENSIKHGLSSLIEGGEIVISISKGSDKLNVEVADTGVGVKDTSALFDKGVGLTNTKLRIEKMYQSQLFIENNNPTGLIVRFTI